MINLININQDIVLQFCSNRGSYTVKVSLCSELAASGRSHPILVIGRGRAGGSCNCFRRSKHLIASDIAAMCFLFVPA